VEPSSEDDRVDDEHWVGCWPSSAATFQWAPIAAANPSPVRSANTS
jgi:hypothetical protein